MEMIKILQGNCLEVMKELPEQSVNTCITSPPYWGLRDYGDGDQLGLEDSPDKFVENLVKVFREVKRVLRDDGTVWLNLGDTYSSHKDCKSTGQTLAKGMQSEQAHVIEKGKSVTRDTKKLKAAGLKNKDLVGIPWRVAFALQADGWYLRQDIIWHKPNPMPESVKDRCTKSHEYIFLLSKNAKYYYDHEAIKEDAVRHGSIPKGKKYSSELADSKIGGKHTRETLNEKPVAAKRNKRSVWTVTTKPFKGAHFATFPPDLIKPCVLAGCPERGTVLDPFGGAGTTGLVADRNGRNAILIELNDEYAEMARDRLYNDAPLFADVESEVWKSSTKSSENEEESGG